jgi:hypothetical protein
VHDDVAASSSVSSANLTGVSVPSRLQSRSRQTDPSLMLLAIWLDFGPPSATGLHQTLQRLWLPLAARDPGATSLTKLGRSLLAVLLCAHSDLLVDSTCSIERSPWTAVAHAGTSAPIDHVECCDPNMRSDGFLSHLCFWLGDDRINFEIIETRLDPLAGARPLLLGHMGPRVPHLDAVHDRAVLLIVPRLRATQRLRDCLRKRSAAAQAQSHDRGEEEAHGPFSQTRHEEECEIRLRGGKPDHRR